MKFKGGWLPDRPDFRDWWYDLAALIKPKPLKAEVDLRAKMPPIWDQGNLGSCVAQSISGMLEYNRIQENQSHFTPSRLFIYYTARAREGTIPVDCGCYIRTAIKCVADFGTPHDNLWPYNPDQFKKKPTLAAFKSASKFKALQYFRLDNTKLDVLKACLNEGECFVFGATMYESFFEANDKGGVVPMPLIKDKELGGHAMLAVGYNEKAKVFIIRNSWGEGVGDKGYYYLPYSYLINNQLVDDTWTIRTTS